MKNQGWIKLYRKTLESWVWNDKTAWRVFSWLILSVDRKNGSVSVGRYQGGKATGLKPVTFQKALLRLKRENMVSLKVSPRYTVVHIINFAQYQGITKVLDLELSTSYPHQSITPDITQQEAERNTTKDFLEQIKRRKLEIIDHLSISN